MGIKIGMQKTVEVEAKYITIFIKACDTGSYKLLDGDHGEIAERSDDYVPNRIIPGEHGDYIDLKINLETGQIVNWEKPTAEDIQEAFFNKDK